MVRVHLHTVCWNERPMLDFFFRHYDPWVEHYFIHDDHSTDGSREYLERRSDVTVETLVRSEPDSWVLSAKQIYDSSWKRSRGAADWVVVPNLDEHLFHPDMRSYLKRMSDDGIGAIPSLGYQMTTEAWPKPRSILWRDYPYGAPWAQMSKMQIFSPAHVREVSFAAGRHRATFEGDVRLPPADEVINLHYKYLGLDNVAARHAAQAGGLREGDIAHNWGHRYRWTSDALTADFRSFYDRRINVHEAAKDGYASHGEPRWWR